MKKKKKRVPNLAMQTVRFNRGQSEQMKKMAKTLGYGKACHIRRVMEMTKDWGADIFQIIKNYSESIGVSESLFLKNVLISFLAIREARKTFYKDTVLHEFRQNNEGEYITDDELASLLVDQYNTEFEHLINHACAKIPETKKVKTIAAI